MLLKNTSSLLVCAALSFGSASAVMANALPVDTAKSELVWSGKKVLVPSSHHGTMKVKSGTVAVKDGKLTEFKIVADMTSIVDKDLSGSHKTKLEGHLKSDDFFGVAKYPTSEFVSTSVTPVSGKSGQYMVKGNLTIKGKTHPLSFTAMTKSSPYRHIAADFSFDRSKYDVRYGSGKFFSNLGDKVIADAIGIKAKVAY